MLKEWINSISTVFNNAGLQSRVTQTKKIDFVIAGAQKSGTTAIKIYLNQSNQLCFSNRKESRYFIEDYNQDVGFKNIIERYQHAETGQLWGDKTPEYLYHEKLPERIYLYNPKMKIIILLRNPVDRAYSAYQMMLRHKWTDLTFLEKIKWDLANVSREESPSKVIVNRGYYATQLKRIFNLFPRNQVKVIKFDDFKISKQAVLDEVCLFLNIDKFTITNEPILPVRKYPKPELKAESLLSKIYYDEVVELEKLLNWNCSDWLDEMTKKCS